MPLKSALVSIFLLAPVALASYLLEHRQPLQRSADVISNLGIAGAAFGGDAVDHVTAVFTIPHITGHPGTSATVVAVLDGFNDCPDKFSSGVQMLIDDNGPFYQGVYQDELGGVYHAFGPRLFAGDEVRVTVGAHIKGRNETGYALLSNRKTNQSWKVDLSSSSPLCLRFGGWLIERVGNTLPNFGTVTLRVAGDGLGKIETLAESTIFDIKGQAKTSISGKDVVIRHV